MVCRYSRLGIERLKRQGGFVIKVALLRTTLSLPVQGQDQTGYDCLNQTINGLGDDKMADNFSANAKANMPGYSTSIFIDQKNIELVAKIEHRIYQMFGLNNRDGWPMQLLKYPTDVGYAPHTDCTMERLDPLDRSFTVLIYLNHIRSGGSTKCFCAS